MTDGDSRSDAVLDVLRSAATHDAAAARSDLIRRRCHRVLARRAAQAARRRESAPGVSRVLEPLVVLGLCAIFLVEVASRALRLYGL